METKAEAIQTVVEQEEISKPEMSKAEICFGALMAVAAICGLWGVTSMLIRVLMGV